MFLFAEKPAVAPSVFVFQKDKGQKVRDPGHSAHTVLRLALPPKKPVKARLTARAWAVTHLHHPPGFQYCGRTEVGEVENSKYWAHLGVHGAYI